MSVTERIQEALNFVLGATDLIQQNIVFHRLSNALK
jgi:hypothetical protein